MFTATAVAMWAIAFRLHIACFVARVVIVGLCFVGEWAMHRKQRQFHP